MAGVHLQTDCQSSLKGQIDEHVIIAFCIGDVFQVAEYPLRSFSHQLHNSVDDVHAPVIKHSAAEFPLASPIPGNSPRTHDPATDLKGLAKKLLLINFSDNQEILIPFPVLPGVKDPICLFGLLHYLQKVGAAQHDGLFAKHMLPRLQGGNGHGFVKMVGRGDQNGIYAFVGQHLLITGINENPL